MFFDNLTKKSPKRGKKGTRLLLFSIPAPSAFAYAAVESREYTRTKASNP
jgi:hypothetical protein